MVLFAAVFLLIDRNRPASLSNSLKKSESVIGAPRTKYNAENLASSLPAKSSRKRDPRLEHAHRVLAKIPRFKKREDSDEPTNLESLYSLALEMIEISERSNSTEKGSLSALTSAYICLITIRDENPDWKTKEILVLQEQTGDKIVAAIVSEQAVPPKSDRAGG